MGKSSKFKKNVKKATNFIWIAGTCIGVLFVVVYLIISLYTGYKEDKRASILTNLSKYNASKFGYISGEQPSLKYRDIKPDITEEIDEVLMNIDAEEVKFPKPYNVVSVLIKEPNDDISVVVDSIKDYVEYWQIIKEGVSYYGTPNDPTVSELDMRFVEYSSEDVDTLVLNLENEIINNDGLIMFVDYNYARVPLFKSLCEGLSNVIDNADNADKLVVEFNVISELGSYTSNLDDLYSLVERIK